MVCAFTRLIRVIVIKDKNLETIIRGLHEVWCLDVGFSTVGFWADNGGELRNMKMEELLTKIGIQIVFTSAFSPWSNGVNERNNYSCDIIVKKAMEEDKKLKLQTAVNMASWTHNTNINTLGYSPLQLVTGKSIVLPGLNNGSIVTES